MPTILPPSLERASEHHIGQIIKLWEDSGSTLPFSEWWTEVQDDYLKDLAEAKYAHLDHFRRDQ